MDILDLTGNVTDEEPERRDIDQTGEEVPETGRGDFEDDEDDFEQGELLDFFNAEYQEAGGVIPLGTIVSNHFEQLNNLSGDDIKRFRKAGTYAEIRQLMSALDTWSVEQEGGARYRRSEKKIFTEANLQLLVDAMEVEKPASPEKKEPDIEPEVELREPDSDEIKRKARQFMSDNGGLASQDKTGKSNMHLFIGKLSDRFDNTIRKFRQIQSRGIPGSRQLFAEFGSLIEGYEGAFRKTEEYYRSESIKHEDVNERARHGIAKQLWSYDKQKQYFTRRARDGKFEYDFVKLLQGYESLRFKVKQLVRQIPVELGPPEEKLDQSKPKPKPKPKPLEALTGGDLYDQTDSAVMSLGGAIRRRFPFIFNEVGYLSPDTIQVLGGQGTYDALDRLFTEYNGRVQNGPPAFGDMRTKGVPPAHGMAIYNWIAELNNANDADRVRKLRGSRQQFKVMYSELAEFEKKWKSLSAKKKVDWKKVRAKVDGPSGATLETPEEKPAPYERDVTGAAAVSKKIKESEGFQKSLVSFLWSEDFAKAMRGDDTKATETLLHQFYMIWKNYFPGLKVTPADWPKQSAQVLRGKTTQYLDDNLFYGKLRGVSRSTITAQKKLGSEDHSKVFKTGKERRPAFLKFVALIQDRQRYLEWAGVQKGPKAPPPAKPKAPLPPKRGVIQQLGSHVQKVIDKWIQGGLHHFQRYGAVGIQMARIPTAVARSNINAQKGVPHVQIVLSVSKFLGMNAPGNGRALLRKLLEDTGTGGNDPQRPWSWNNIVTKFGSGAEEIAANVNKIFEHYVTSNVAREVGRTLQVGSFPNTAAERRIVAGLTDAERILYEIGEKTSKKSAVAAQDEEKKDPKQEAREREHKRRMEAHEERKAKANKLAQEHSMASAARRKNQVHGAKIEEQHQAILKLLQKINHPANDKQRQKKERYQQALKDRKALIRQLQDESAPPTKKPDTLKEFDVSGPAPPTDDMLSGLPRSPSPSPEPPDLDERGRSPSPGPRRTDLSTVQPRRRRPPRNRRPRSVSPPRSGSTVLSGTRPRRKHGPRGGPGPRIRPPPSARPSHAGQVGFSVPGVQRSNQPQRRQPMPPVRPRPQPPAQVPPVNMQNVAPQQIFAGPLQLSPAQQDLRDRNDALAALRNHPRFRPEFEKNFVYDPNSKTYKEKRKAYYSYAPIARQYLGTYQLQAVHNHEVAYIRPKHPGIETFQRNDVYDVARKFNRDAKTRPIDGRARQYLKVGPWIRLRLLKTSVHITRKGTPPQKAFAILAKHLLKQIEQAEKPRIVAPNFKGSKKQFLTIATTDVLQNITLNTLTKLLEKGLRRKTKHIIYRQTNSGGPLMEYAKKNEALY